MSNLKSLFGKYISKTHRSTTIIVIEFQMRSMLTYLEAVRYKITASLNELDNRPIVHHPLASHIQIIRDKQGLQQSILKVSM